MSMLMFGYGNGMMSNYGYGMGYGGMFFGLLFWIFIIVLAYLLIKYLINRNKAHGVEGKSALDSQKKDMPKVKSQKKNLRK